MVGVCAVCVRSTDSAGYIIEIKSNSRIFALTQSLRESDFLITSLQKKKDLFDQMCTFLQARHERRQRLSE